MKNNLTKEELMCVPLPLETKYYKPIPHSILFDEVYEGLYRKGLNVTNESIDSNADGEKLIAKLRLDKGDSEKSFMLAFRNSYDKSMSVGFCAGVQIMVN